MSIQKYVEVTCDDCGNANHAIGGNLSSAKKQLRGHGLVFSKYGDFCDKECLDNFRKVTT